MMRRIRQWLCARKGHPHETITVPIVGEHPWDPDHDETYCQGCGVILRQEWTDSAGTEHR